MNNLDPVALDTENPPKTLWLLLYFKNTFIWIKFAYNRIEPFQEYSLMNFGKYRHLWYKHHYNQDM